MRLRTLAPLLAAAGLVLSGCSTSPTAAPSPTASSPALSPEASASPTPTAEPERLVITLDALTYVDGPTSEAYPIEEGAAVVDLLDELTGTTAVGEQFDGPYGSEGGVRYEWAGVTVAVFTYDGAASVTVDAATIGDVPISTSEGIAVGSTREAALAAGAFDDWDADGDGIADVLGIQPVEVPDAESLTRPGTPGIRYIALELTDDVVTAIRWPSNDFSDI